MVIKMSREANPYDNAKADSFMKALKYKEVDCEGDRDLIQAHTSIADFLEKEYTSSGTLGSEIPSARGVRVCRAG
jgi:hypothetical protein